MRILILCLVLANLGFLAWTSWVAPRPAPPPPYEGPGITLLRELEREVDIVSEAPAPAVPATPAPADPEPGSAETAATPDEPAVGGEPAVANACVAIGPFAGAEALDAALASFAEAGFAATAVASEDEVWDGYWVYIERIESRTAANEMLAELAANGIDEAYMIPNSDSGILVSLGVFSDISRAGSLAAEVGRLDLEATISERTRLAETTWLEVEAEPEAGDELLALLQMPGRISRLEQRACR